MTRNILILGASYGSLLGTKLLMAGHNVTLVCRKKTAELINRDGTEVRIKLRDEAMHRAIFSRDLPGKLDATEPGNVDISRYDMVALAMQEPQYTNHTVRVLMVKIAAAGLPCLSIMNMPPLPYLKRIPALADMDLEEAYTNAQVWERFKPGLLSLCSPDPQAFRPPEEAANVLHVGLPTNFKASTFADEQHNKVLRELEADIDAVTLDGHDVPVKLKVFDSLFVPLAKWNRLKAFHQFANVLVVIQRFDWRMTVLKPTTQILCVFGRDVRAVLQHDLGNVRRRRSAEDRAAKAGFVQTRQVAAVVDVCV